MNNQTDDNPDAEQFEQRWPVDNQKATVVIVHGLGEHSGRYAPMVQALNAAGYGAASLDLSLIHI